MIFPAKEMSKMNALFNSFPFAEISGAFGDLGTLLPILVSLSATGQINLTASLVFGGLFNIISGLYFGIPMCVQPMKSIAAIALLANLSMQEIVAAGLSVSIALLVFASTGMMRLFNSYIPLYIVRGIQLGTGLTLVAKGITSVTASKSWSFVGYDWSDNYVIAILSLVLVLAFWRSKYTASALLLFIAGIIIACTKVKTVVSFGPQFIVPFVPTGPQFWTGFIKAGLGQIPLTVSNSVIAVSILADDLFPNMTNPRTDVTRVSLWVAAMNIFSCWFGSMPYCCGSGGLAAQYRFGARSGVSVIVLGVFKILAGLLFGNSLLAIFKLFPSSIIGIMLIVAGLQIALITVNLVENYESKQMKEDAYLIMIVTATSIVGFANDGIGFLIGVSTATLLHLSREKLENHEPLAKEAESGESTIAAVVA